MKSGMAIWGGRWENWCESLRLSLPLGISQCWNLAAGKRLGFGWHFQVSLALEILLDNQAFQI